MKYRLNWECRDCGESNTVQKDTAGTMVISMVCRFCTRVSGMMRLEYQYDDMVCDTAAHFAFFQENKIV